MDEKGMYLQEFPNIDWLRRTALKGFSDRQDYQGNQLSSKGWPNVILSTKSTHTERDNIKGSFSLFCNLEGTSLVGVNRDWHKVSNDFYCMTNMDEHYHLHIPKGKEVTTFNIHFGQRLYDEVLGLMSMRLSKSLDDFGHVHGNSFEILPRTHYLDDALRALMLSFRSYRQICGGNYCLDKEFEMLATLLELVITRAHRNLKKIDGINAHKRSTRQELMRRVNLGVEYIHSYAPSAIALDDIARHSGLSKFHFLRVFREVYGQTPTDYISSVRLNKAQHLLGQRHKTLSEVALELGFSELSAFTRFYKRMTGNLPSAHLPIGERMKR